MGRKEEKYFEIFLSKDELTKEDWQKLYKAVSRYSGLFPKFQIIVTFKDNLVRFFIRSHKDLGNLSSNLEGMIVRDCQEDPEIPAHRGKQRFIQFKAGGNLLDLKEKYEVKKSIVLEYFVCNIRSFGPEKAKIRTYLYFKNLADEHMRASKLMTFFPANLLAMDFSASGKYMKKEIGRYLNIEKSLKLLNSNKTTPLFKAESFPYLKTDYYINLTDYEFDKHSFIVGASGTGKSKFISLYVDRLANSAMRENYRVVVIDPHAALEPDFQHLASKKIINFSRDGAELFSEGSHDIQAATELTTVLFRSLMADQNNPRLEKVLRFSLYVLMTAQNMSLDTLKRFLIETELRNQMLEHVKGFAPDNVIKFFGGDFRELYTQHYNDAIQPIVSLVDEMQLQPSLVGHNEVSLVSTIKDNFLTVFSLNKVSMGEKVTKTISGLLIQQIFLLAQSRQFQQKVILIIDEVSIVQNPALAQILAEARKFNLSVILSQQYFGQIDKDLQDAIFANIFNYYVFKVSEEDARALEGNINIELPQAVIEADTEKGLKEKDIKVKIITELNPRECLVRLAANGQLYPCVKVKTMDATFGNQVGLHEVREDLEKVVSRKLPTKFIEKESAPELAGLPSSPPANQEKTGGIQSVGQPLPVGDASAKSIFQPATAPRSVDASAMPEPTMEFERPMINLSMILSEHSSSRKIVNKRKAGS